MRLFTLILLLGLTGCQTFGPNGYTVQRMTPYDRFDPFPDHNLGPETHQRPRGFDTQRTFPRQQMENRMLQGAPATLPPGAVPVQPMPTPNGPMLIPQNTQYPAAPVPAMGWRTPSYSNAVQ